MNLKFLKNTSTLLPVFRQRSFHIEQPWYRFLAQVHRGEISCLADRNFVRNRRRPSRIMERSSVAFEVSFHVDFHRSFRRPLSLVTCLPVSLVSFLGVNRDREGNRHARSSHDRHSSTIYRDFHREILSITVSHPIYRVFSPIPIG